MDEDARKALFGLVALMTMSALMAAVLFVGLYLTLGSPPAAGRPVSLYSLDGGARRAP